jgi:tRNA-splicing ligase RtcB
MKVIGTERLPIKMWLEDIEDGAMDQIKNLANLPFAYKHIAIMPDCHQGYGMPIGGVLAAEGVVIPNAVGTDIGCGMSAIKTSLTNLNTETLKQIMGKIRELVPVGFNHQKEAQEWSEFDQAPDIQIVQQQLNAARKQLGTLGGGNHFIEIQKGDDGFIWAMVHSGSRNFGLKIANEYNKIAQKLCAMWYSNIPAFKGDDGLAFLPIETYQAKEYMVAMHYALRFAYENRLQMLSKIRAAFTSVLTCDFENEINIHHNYAQYEHHFGKNIILHRKGATSARLGEIGIIPGSQGTASYIVEGKGNPESFMSCSHGAGRVMARNQAKKELNLEKEKEILDKKNIVHSIRTTNDLDEASSAYKDIDVVMENQKELVDIKVKLIPLGVIKG